MSVSRDGLLLSARASEVNFSAVLKRAQTSRCPGSRKKSIHQSENMWADKSKESKVEKVEKSRRLHGAGTPRAAAGFVLHSRTLALLWRRSSPAVVLFHVKPRQSLAWSDPGAVK